MLPTTFNVAVNQSDGYDPQPIYVEQESIGINKAINKLPPVVRAGRMNYVNDLADLGESPSGQLTYEFRASDLVKPLFAHFQNGDFLGSSFRYVFYPTTKQVRNYTTGGYTVGSYGLNPQKAYQLRVDKQLANGSFYSFSGGIVDKLQFNLDADETAKVTCGFVFTDYSINDYYMDVPSGTFSGTYSTESAFSFEDVHVSVSGTNFPISSLSFTGDHGAQVIKTVGAKNPKRYLLGNYKVNGKIDFDLPEQALKLVGSMLSLSPFSVVGTLVQGTSKVSFNMPNCVRTPFDYSLKANMVNTGEIKFDAFASPTVPPLTITVDTDYDFVPFTSTGGIENTPSETDTITSDPYSTDLLING